jgi:hypothetical protein
MSFVGKVSIVRHLLAVASGSQPACLFPNHLAHTLVFPAAAKDGLTEPIFARPLCEFELANERRLNPNDYVSCRQPG